MTKLVRQIVVMAMRAMVMGMLLVDAFMVGFISLWNVYAINMLWFSTRQRVA